MLITTPRGQSALLNALRFPILLVVLIQVGFLCFGVRLNTTASLPIGLYVETSDPKANLIEFCPTGDSAAIALSRGYRSSGVCPDGGEPLMKPIVAKSGDVVRVSQDGVAVNSRFLPNSRPQNRDSVGRGLISWPSGTYPVAEGTFWTISSFNARSFDSRYFGPIQISSVRARLKPLLTE